MDLDHSNCGEPVLASSRTRAWSAGINGGRLQGRQCQPGARGPAVLLGSPHTRILPLWPVQGLSWLGPLMCLFRSMRTLHYGLEPGKCRERHSKLNIPTQLLMGAPWAAAHGTPRFSNFSAVGQDAGVCLHERSAAVSLILVKHLVFIVGETSPGWKFTLCTSGALQK